MGNPLSLNTGLTPIHHGLTRLARDQSATLQEMGLAPEGMPAAAPGGASWEEHMRGVQQRVLGHVDDTVNPNPLAEAMQINRPYTEPIRLTPAAPDEGAGYAPQLTGPGLGETVYGAGAGLVSGLRNSFVGRLIDYTKAEHAFGKFDDPTYDPFKDQNIKDRGFEGQWHLFEFSRSAIESDWVMNRSTAQAKEAFLLSRMPGQTGIPEMVGGLVGDPTTYLPFAMSSHVVANALQSVRRGATAAQLQQFGLKPILWAGYNKALIGVVQQASMVLAINAVEHGFDPTYEVDNYAALLALPMAIGASVGAITGALERGALQRNFWIMRQNEAKYSFGGPAYDKKYGPPGPGEMGGPAATPEQAAAQRKAWETWSAQAYAAYGNDVERHMQAKHDAGWDPRLELLRPGALRTDFDIVQARQMVRDAELDRAEEIMKRGDFSPKARDFEGQRLEALDTARAELTAEKAPTHGADFSNDIPPDYKGFVSPEEAARQASPKGSVGAAIVNPALLDRETELAGNRLVKAGWLPMMPLNMIFRAAASNLTSFQDVIEGLLDPGGLQRVKNVGGVVTGPSTEKVIQANWNLPMVLALRGTLAEWRKLREGGDYTEAGPIANFWKASKLRAADWQNNTGQLSYEAFRRRVGDALNNGDKDLVTDGATKHVEAAAGHNRALYEKVKKEAIESGVFRDSYEKTLAQRTARQQILAKEQADLEAEQSKIELRQEADKKAGTKTPDQTINRLREIEGRLDEIPQEIERAKQQTDTIAKKLDKLLRGELDASDTALSYRPRLWLAEKLRENETEFRSIVTQWLRSKGVDDSKIERIVDTVYLQVSKQMPLYVRGDLDDLFQGVADPMSAHAITFNIPDQLVSKFLENDSEALMRHHIRQMGAAIEMKKRWGSTDLAEEVQSIIDEAKQYNIPDAERDAAVKDVLAARDRIYGTYGAAADPHRWQSRTIRTAKQYANLSVLGMSGFSSIIDLVRPAMTEGLQAVHHYGYKSLIDESAPLIRKMALHELNKGGDGLELELSLKAASAADSGDMFMQRSSLERGMNKMNGLYFMMNGLNIMNQLDKHWATLIIQGNVNDELMALAKGGQLSDLMRSRLAAAGIENQMAKRIAGHIDEHGIQYNSIRLANSDAWKDPEAELAYGTAINSMTNRTVPTPGLGDRPNFMSTELGSLLTQYKAFGVGSTIRNLYAGLQEPGNHFWTGAAIMVGGGILLNEIRAQLFGTQSTFNRPLTAVIADGVDKSGILGFFSDGNRAVETLSNHHLGVRPLIGAESPHRETPGRQIGAVAGPAIGQATTGADVLYHFMAGHPNAQTFRDARHLIPGNDLPFIRKGFDAAQRGVRETYKGLGGSYETPKTRRLEQQGE